VWVLGFFPDRAKENSVTAFPRHESAALLGFAVTPVTFFVIGMFSKHSYFAERYES
jgi:hypothetical protein